MFFSTKSAASVAVVLGFVVFLRVVATVLADDAPANITCEPSGVITIAGSSLGLPIATTWANDYRQACGNTTSFTVTSNDNDSGTQHVCGADFPADIGIVSRPLESTEWTTTDGYNFQCPAPSTRTVVQLQVAIDAVVLVVAPKGSAAYCVQQLFNNGLTLEQLRLLYSSYTVAQLYNIPTTAPSESPTTLPFAPPLAPSGPPTTPPQTPFPTIPPSFTRTAGPVRPPTKRPSSSRPTLKPTSKPTDKSTIPKPVVNPVTTKVTARPTLIPTSKPTVKQTIRKPVTKPVTTKAPTSTKRGGMMTPTAVLTPTSPPVVPPTFAPVIPHSLAPVVPPSLAPVVPPSFSPFVPPTFAPVVPPVFAPVKLPTFVPISSPTLAPALTFVPIQPPTIVVVPTSGPIGKPTRRPTVRPSIPKTTLGIAKYWTLNVHRTRANGEAESICNNIQALVAGPPITSETFQHFARLILPDYGDGEDITSTYYDGIDTSDIVSYLQNNTNAIAFMSLADFAAYRNQLQVVYVMTRNGESTEPNRDNLHAGRYPLSYNIYMDARSDDPVTLSRLQPFFAFAYSLQGDNDVSVNGLVPISDAVQAQMMARLSTNSTTVRVNQINGK